MPEPHDNPFTMGARLRPTPAHQVVQYAPTSVCWSCGMVVEGDPTHSIRRCADCDVSWKVEIVPTRPPAAVEQGSATGYGYPNRPWNQYIRRLLPGLREGD